MPKTAGSVPYGYESETERQRGTLIYYDSFEHTSDEELDRAASNAEERSFAKLVLYPLHEETVKRMTREKASPFYKREDRLHDWKRERGLPAVAIESWDGKRKKYTPVDTALRFLTEKYDAPHFLYLTPETANMFASFASFEEWIVKLRLLLASEPASPHPNLERYRHRWSAL
ncbi:hypothetical protein [Paenibacillus humicola]|uniref:hypothetical protein n=1 Tax=Paenibacillus humicola TaxID=3110540 RepID=UPI00237B5983|nr:hypothetical protein [Paenibacillus humicola]